MFALYKSFQQNWFDRETINVFTFQLFGSVLDAEGSCLSLSQAQKSNKLRKKMRQLCNR